MEIEICCGSVQSAVNAKQAGATRIELCQNLNEGGTTPSFATIQQCIDLGLSVFVLIRPRPGNFVYNDIEVENMMLDLQCCVKMGVAGVVIGFLRPDGSVDTALTQRFVEAAGDVPVTFHRAFDECPDQLAALQDVIRCGCRRILTSGGAANAMEGKEQLRTLVREAGDRITILVGGGVRAGNIQELIAHTGAREAHGSCKARTRNGNEETETSQVRNLLEKAQVLR